LALDSLNYYSKSDGSYAHLASELYTKLRSNLIQNIATQYAKTGFLWENYNDTTGEGLGTHPFTGWTTLVVNILANSYD
jgi:mannosyl-oligosaccharide glucosidase